MTVRHVLLKFEFPSQASNERSLVPTWYAVVRQSRPVRCASITYPYWLVAWRSGNALCLINEVTLRRARLIPGWVTVCGQVNHLTSHSGRLSLLPSMGWWNEYQLSDSVVINGDSDCSIIAASLGLRQIGLVQRSAAARRSCYIYQMNRVNSRSDCATMTAP